MKQEVEIFFDRLAPTWDEGECCPKEKKLALLSQVDIQKGDFVLDVACGTGVVTGLLFELSQAPLIGIDISEEMIKRAQKKYEDNPAVSFVHGDLLSYEHNALFDDIIIYNAYPHFMNPAALSRKCASLLKQGGRLAIIHSLSRKQLEAHHSGSVKPLSRSLGTPMEEAKAFPQFNVIQAKEDEGSYLLVLEKA